MIVNECTYYITLFDKLMLLGVVLLVVFLFYGLVNAVIQTIKLEKLIKASNSLKFRRDFGE